MKPRNIHAGQATPSALGPGNGPSRRRPFVGARLRAGWRRATGRRLAPRNEFGTAMRIACAIAKVIVVPWALCTGPVIEAAPASWERVETSGLMPGPRRGVPAVFDEARQRIIFQGGEMPGGFLAETLVLNVAGFTWARPSVPLPPARCHQTFVSDPARHRALMFGGFPRNNELWQFTPASDQWTNLTPANNPIPARCLHVAVVCPTRNEMIVYGGLIGGFAPDLEDTWSYNLTNAAWTLVQPASPPGPRYGSVAALDATKDRLVLFGGLARLPTGQITEVGDVWEFNLAARQWSRLSAIGDHPSPRQFAAAVLLPQSDGFLLFGGLANEGAGQAYQNDLYFYSFRDDRWQAIDTAGPRPPARFRHTLVLDASSGSVYLAFGQGAQGNHFNDLWRLDLNAVQLSDGRVTARLEVQNNLTEGILSWQAEPVVYASQATNLVWPDYQVWRSSDWRTWQPVGAVVASPRDRRSVTQTVPLDSDRAEFFRVESVRVAPTSRWPKRPSARDARHAERGPGPGGTQVPAVWLFLQDSGGGGGPSPVTGGTPVPLSPSRSLSRPARGAVHPTLSRGQDAQRSREASGSSGEPLEAGSLAWRGRVGLVVGSCVRL